MTNKNENNRFRVIYSEKLSTFEEIRILKDRQTSVLYYFHRSGNAIGLTPLLDRDGKPSIDTNNSY